MRSSQKLAIIGLLLSPVWRPTSLLRSQGFLASRSTSKPPTTGAPEAGTNKAPAGATGIGLVDTAPVRSNLSRPPAFIENRGQFDKKVRFQLAGGGNSIWLAASGIAFDILRPKEGASPANAQKPRFDPRHAPQPKASDFQRLVVSENFVGANPSPGLEPRSPQPGIYNYLIGNDPAKWHTNVKQYAEVVYRNVWDRVDLRLYPNGSGLEQEFVLAPGGDPSQIRITYRGIEGLGISDDGSLSVRTALGNIRETAPKVYQEIAGKRIAVTAQFRLLGTDTYTFEVGSHPKQYTLVIDPTLLFSTYIGGTGRGDFGTGVATDPMGNAYVSGYTYFGTYPTTPGAYQASCPSSSNCSSAVVSKFDAVGRPQYSTYLGSSLGYDVAKGIAVDASGEAYVTGYANTGFPTALNAFQTSCAGGSDFMAKLDATGAALLYSTCLGYNEEYVNQSYGGGAHAIALDAAGRAYVTGDASDSENFPSTPNAVQPAIVGAGNVFMSIIDPSLSGPASLVYSTFLGSSANGGDSGRAIAVDAYGNVYLTGETDSQTFPVTAGAFQTTDKQTSCPGIGVCETAFVAKISPTVSGLGGLLYSTYLGGTDNGGAIGDTGYGIAVDTLGNAYVVGVTASPNFPTTPGAFQSMLQCTNGFVTKLNAAGNALVYSTFLGTIPMAGGGCGTTEVLAVALDSAGNAYVVGYTAYSGFPVTAGTAFQTAYAGNGDAFLTELNSSGSNVIYSSYLGGSGDDEAAGLAIDAVGDVTVTGFTQSANFPITPFAYQPVISTQNESDCDGYCPNVFVTKFPLGSPGALSVTGIIPNSGGNAGTVSPQISGGGFHAGTTAQLNCGTQVVPGTNVTVGTGGQLLNTTFDLTATAPGSCSVIVTGVDGTSVTLSNAFTVRQGGAPNIVVSKTGTTAMKPPLDQPTWSTNVTYYITVTNTGNVDSPNNSYLSESLDMEFTPTSVAPPALANVPTLAAYSFILWSVPLLPAGGSQQYTYSTTVDPSTPVGTQLVGGPACFIPFYEDYFMYQCLEQQCPAAYQSCVTASDDCSGKNGVNGVLNCYNAGISCVSQAQSGCTFGVCKTCFLAPLQICEKYLEQLLGGPSDPNYLAGPSGVASQKWISGTGASSWVLGFSNDVKATAPAQRVIVTLPLSSNVNMSTLKLLGMTIASSSGAPSIQVTIPPGAFNPAAGLDEFTTNVDLRPAQSLFVLVDAALNPSTDTITWTFTSIDPTTGQPPANAGVGFLPPGASASVAFAVAPTPGQLTGATISEQGSVIFSNSGTSQPPVSTKTWTNTLDSTAPASQVKALPAHSCLDFKVSWSGTDVGSGIQDYTVYASDTGGPFTPWQTNTPASSATYQGQDRHSYRFYSIARDRVGNLEAPKSAAEATTFVAKTTTCGGPPSLAGSATVASLSGTTLTLALQITNNGTETANSITVSNVVPIVLSGAGKVTLAGPALPIAVGDLAPGASATVTLVLSVPSTVTNLALIEPGTMQDAQAKTYAYTLGQEVVP